MTTSALSRVQILELLPECPVGFMLEATRGARVDEPSLAGRNKAEAPEVRPPGFTDRQPFPCNAWLASAYPSDA